MWQVSIIPLLLHLLYACTEVSIVLNGQLLTAGGNSNDPFLFVNNGSLISFDDANTACQTLHNTHLAVIDSLQKLLAANSTCIEKGQ